MMERFGKRGQIRAKGRGNFVTETDLACERLALDVLTGEFPGVAVLSEETADSGHSLPLRKHPWLWVVDPLDGTHNYSQGIPHFAFNIALCREGEPVLGLTYAPALGLEFLAESGKGLLVNGEQARASKAASVKESVWGADFGYDNDRAARLLALIAEVWPGVQALRVMGSAALGIAFAASGRFDLFVHHYLFPWDIAAGIVMAGESGATIVDRDGGPVSVNSEGVVVGAPGAVADFLRLSRGKAWR
jgi:fructose-1,6-bisphosphatase/inositol monophosphatase family enzyme